MIEPAHERIQPAGDGEAWNDSLYFNFFSEGGEVSGFTRIGVLANAGQANAGLVALKGGVPFAGMIADKAKFPAGDWDDLEVEGLRFRVIEPLKRCAVDLDAPAGKASLEFEALAPAFDYADCPVEVPAEVASRHYEQHCRVTGWIEGQGQRHEITGFGQRDHSWGLRDWAGVRTWRWLQAIFGENLAFNVFCIETHDGETMTSGYVHEDGKSLPVAEASIDTDYDGDGRVQKAVSVHVKDTGGVERTIAAERFAMIPLPMESTQVNEGLFRWELDGRTGFGMYEHLYQT